MRILISLILAAFGLTAGSAQTLPVKFGRPFKAPKLKIEWKASATNLPPSVWEYRLLPKEFPTRAISNLLAAGDLTWKDQAQSERGTMLFQKSGGSASLWVSPKLGEIQFERNYTYGFTNLAKNIPQMGELFQLTTNFMAVLNIPIGEVEKKPDGSPDFHFWEPLSMFAEGSHIVTNIAFRGARFRRSVDGGSFVGNGAGGDCDLQFGERGVVTRAWLTWRNLEKLKEFKTASPQKMMDWIRKGQAVQGRTRVEAPEIDWKNVKQLTINNSKLCYYGGTREKPSERLVPFAALWGFVDMGVDTIELEIDCPLIDEAKP